MWLLVIHIEHLNLWRIKKISLKESFSYIEINKISLIKIQLLSHQKGSRLEIQVRN